MGQGQRSGHVPLCHMRCQDTLLSTGKASSLRPPSLCSEVFSCSFLLSSPVPTLHTFLESSPTGWGTLCSAETFRGMVPSRTHPPPWDSMEAFSLTLHLFSSHFLPWAKLGSLSSSGSSWWLLAISLPWFSSGSGIRCPLPVMRISFRHPGAILSFRARDSGPSSLASGGRSSAHKFL